MLNDKLYISENMMQQTGKSEKITAQAYEHAMRLVRENYPSIGEERLRVMAVRLAEKICRKERR